MTLAVQFDLEQKLAAAVDKSLSAEERRQGNDDFFAGKKESQELKSAELGIGRKLLEWKRKRRGEEEEVVNHQSLKRKWQSGLRIGISRFSFTKEDCFPSQPER